MTLVLTWLDRGRTIQVSDRLLTRVRGTAVEPFDPSSNKSLIFRARDALCLIGYCGRAYIDALPTDSWIAQSLIGGKVNPQVMATSCEQGINWLDIGSSVRRLARELQASFSRLGKRELTDHPIQISVAGWRQAKRRDGIEPVYCELLQSPGHSEVNVMWKRANWNWGREGILAAIPGHHLTPVTALLERLKSQRNAPPEVGATILVDAVREFSREDPGIGADCLQVQFGPDWKPMIQFFPHGELPVQEPNSTPYAFSPWIIAPPSVMAPSTTNCGWSTQNLSWNVVGLPEQTSPYYAFQSRQVRPKYP